jgi:hypothetical protein
MCMLKSEGGTEVESVCIQQTLIFNCAQVQQQGDVCRALGLLDYLLLLMHLLRSPCG